VRGTYFNARPKKEANRPTSLSVDVPGGRAPFGWFSVLLARSARLDPYPAHRQTCSSMSEEFPVRSPGAVRTAIWRLPDFREALLFPIHI
jgi:hypothetical protein